MMQYLKTPTIAWQLTQMSPGRILGMNGYAMPTKAARAVIQLSLFSGCAASAIGRSEKTKSWKSKNGQADHLPRHSPDVRTVFEI